MNFRNILRKVDYQKEKTIKIKGVEVIFISLNFQKPNS